MHRKWVGLLGTSILFAMGYASFQSSRQWDAYFTHFDQGQHFSQKGFHTAAAEEFRLAYQAKPTDTNTLGKWGKALSEAGNSTEAVPLLEQALETFPQRTYWRLPLAKSYLCLGETEKAKSHLKLLVYSQSDETKEAKQLLKKLNPR